MKVTQIKRKLDVTVAPTWAATNGGEWTITTSAAHYVAVGEVVSFLDPFTTSYYSLTAVTGTTNSTLVLASANSKLVFPKSLEFVNYGGNISSDVFTLSFGSVPNGIVSVNENGTAAGTVELQVSLDNIHWKAFAVAAAITNTPDFTEFNITKPYAYGKLVFTSVTGADGGANTITAFKSGC